jgi:ribosomal protein S27AE
MIFDINYEFEEHGVYLFKTDYGVEYKVTLREDDYTSIGISIISNIKYDNEVFTTAQTLEYLLNKVKVEKFILTIDDINIKTRFRKLNILKRWLESYDYTVINNPHLPSIGRGNSNVIMNITQIYLIKKKETKKRKYCTNCGTEDTGYKFCPNCGGNLQV